MAERQERRAAVRPPMAAPAGMICLPQPRLIPPVPCSPPHSPGRRRSRVPDGRHRRRIRPDGGQPRSASGAIHRSYVVVMLERLPLRIPAESIPPAMGVGMDPPFAAPRHRELLFARRGVRIHRHGDVDGVRGVRHEPDFHPRRQNHALLGRYGSRVLATRAERGIPYGRHGSGPSASPCVPSAASASVSASSFPLPSPFRWGLSSVLVIHQGGAGRFLPFRSRFQGPARRGRSAAGWSPAPRSGAGEGRGGHHAPYGSPSMHRARSRSTRGARKGLWVRISSRPRPFSS